MACTPLGTTTPTLGLCKPATGETGWGAAINGNFDLIDALAATLAAFAAPLDTLTGLNLAYVSTTSITVSVGAASSDDSTLANRVLISLTSAITGTTAGTWVVGNNQPKLDAGTVGNNQWWHVFAIKRVDTGVGDFILSLSATSPTLPANYTKQRRIGSIKTNGSAQVIQFSQEGDEFLWNAIPTVYSAANPGASAVLATLEVPTGVKVLALISVQVNNGTTANLVTYVSSPDVSDEVPSATAAPLNNVAYAAAATGQGGTPMRIRTNTSAQVRHRSPATGASDTVRIATTGWIDRRGRG